MKLAWTALAPVLLVLAGCASDDESVADASATAAPDWRNIATSDDRGRLREWRTALVRALAKAQASGHGATITREGTLLEPDAAIDWRDPPPGLYSCRTVKVGGQSAGMLDYVAYPPFDCRIRSEEGLLSLTKLKGSQRPIGLLLPYAANRMVFLGTLQLGDETRALEYGRDQERDLVALVERIGQDRWRLIFPYPHFESIADVMELVPKPPSS